MLRDAPATRLQTIQPEAGRLQLQRETLGPEALRRTEKIGPHVRRPMPQPIQEEFLSEPSGQPDAG